MNNKTTIVIITQTLIIVVLIWIIILLGDKTIIGINPDEEESDEEVVIDYTTIINGITQIKLPSSVEANSNIQYKPLESTQINQKKLNYGLVQNISQLTKAKTNLANINHQIEKLNHQLKHEKNHLEALKVLNADDKNISDLAINTKQIEISDLDNEINIHVSEKINILNMVKQQWGEVFVDALKNKNHPLNKILKNKNQLISLSITQGDREQTPPKNIVIIPSVSSTSEIKAKLLARSPIVDKSIIGKNFFYVTNNNKLTIGERISAYALESNSNQTFLLVPNSSVIWSNGQPWAYVRIKDNGNFVRRSLQGMHEAENGWIIPAGKIKMDDEIVTNGAQLLLSEEFKYQIKNENED